MKRSKYAVELHKVYKAFGKEMILKGITHGFERGKIHGIVGFNGSGKTVMLKCICGFLRPTKGRIVVEGKRIGRDTDFPPSIGLIIENPGFIPYMSGMQNLYRLARLGGKIGKPQVRQAMREVGLDPDMKKPVRTYSLGMRERLGIAQAIMERPDILVLDEPFNGLDRAGVAEVCRLLSDYRDEGKTILLAAHNFEELGRLCDTVIQMDAGRIVKKREKICER